MIGCGSFGLLKGAGVRLVGMLGWSSFGLLGVRKFGFVGFGA